mmetsp:Transcript_126405/g.316013  ORF Transcript_126405/g.316013 Transcript_126405/m.316013 type:complete len:365 (-) Transcript_126405:433-1527(-)
MRCLITASTSNFRMIRSPPFRSSSGASSSPVCPSPTAAASSARWPAKCDMGWSRWTSNREFKGRCLPDTSPFIDQVLSSICSSSSLATSSSKARKRLSMSYNDLPLRPSLPPSWSSSSPSSDAAPVTSESLSSLSSSSPSGAASFCNSRIFFSNSRSSSDNSSPSPPKAPSSSSSSSSSPSTAHSSSASSASSSLSSSCRSTSSPRLFPFGWRADFAALLDASSSPASPKKSENIAFSASSSSSSSPTSSKSKSLSPASSSMRILPSAKSANLFIASIEKNLSSPSSPSFPIAGLLPFFFFPTSSSASSYSFCSSSEPSRVAFLLSVDAFALLLPVAGSLSFSISFFCLPRWGAEAAISASATA